MGWLKRIVGGAKIAGGIATGNPGLAVSGGADIATSFGDGGKTSPSVTPPQTRVVDVGPKPPLTAGSLEESRAQNRTRMSRQYKFPLGVLLLAALLGLPAKAQQSTVRRTYTATTGGGTDLGVKLIGTGVTRHQLSWTVSGTVSSCTVLVDSSADNSSWSSGGIITAQTCTTNGNTSLVNANVNYGRINFSALTGTGSVTAVWLGYTTSGGSSGGYVYNGVLSGIPATCAIGDLSFITNATPGQQIYMCSALNTWTQQLNSGAGGASTALDNIVSPAVNVTITPGVTNAIDLGSAAKLWRATYVNSAIAAVYNTVVIKADQSAGADAVAKYNACSTAAASAAGICDATAITGAQSGTNLTVPTKVRLLLGDVTLTHTGKISKAAGASIIGLGPARTAITCVTVGGSCFGAPDTTTTYGFGEVSGIKFTITGASSIGLNTAALTNTKFRDLEIDGSSHDGQALILCDGSTQDSTYNKFEDIYLTTGSASTNGTDFKVVGACNQNSGINIRMTVHSNTDVGVSYDIGGGHLPNRNTWVGGGVEGSPTGTGIGVKEIQSGGGNNHFGFGMEALNQKIVRPTSGSSYGVSFFGLYSQNNTTAVVDNGGLLFADFQSTGSLRPIMDGWGISDAAPSNLIVNGTMECWTSATANCNWTGINWTGAAWDFAANELVRKASSALTYKNSDNTTIATSGTYAAEVTDGTPANAGNGIMGPCFKIEPRKQYTLHALLGVDNTGTLFRYGFKFYTDAACASSVSTDTTNTVYSTYAEGVSGDFVPPVSLTYNRTLAGHVNFPASMSGVDIAASGAAATMSPFIAIFRPPTSTAAHSARPVFLVNTVGGLDDTLYVDDVYVGESWAKNTEEDSPFMAGPSGIIPVGLAASPVGGKCLQTLGTTGLAVEAAAACGTGGGAGTVTVVGGGSLTSTALVTGGGTTTIQTPSATSTLDASGNMSVAGTLTATTLSTGGTPPSCSAGTGGIWCAGEGTAGTGAAGVDMIYALSASHRFAGKLNNGSEMFLPFLTSACTAGQLPYAAASTYDFTCNPDFSFATHTLSSGASGILDLSAASATAGFKLPSVAGAAPTTAAVMSYDSTANRPVAGNGSITLKMAALIASGTSAMGTAAISSGTCATVVTTAATGVATTDVIQATPNADPTGVTGYGPSASGSLFILAYPTSGNVNFKVCNNTSGSITPAALTLNWTVVR